ncbi:helix-turn-helix domain-containing protein [Crossiella sp. SN42]|uniref:helix-turn-helix transcriptional regulator n=1 Tax=Crossiella sp. SN42 TaxID=2944808 RepID=UPI00207C6B0F|nr:helix-turn-helix transcriptional regulator [Crossiella sp. SN42]MCO1575515.1 helix-turn-helix domain-containing protein [Crossiella sp. SN42]
MASDNLPPAEVMVHTRLEENLALFRRARSYSQEELAERSGVSVDTISAIESGKRGNCRSVTVERLARGLDVTVTVLLGLESPSQQQTAEALNDLRRAITASAEIPGLHDFAESVEVFSVEAIAATGHSAWRTYVGGRDHDLLHLLPSVLADARRLVHNTRGDAQAVAERHLSVAYRLGAGLAGRFGLTDLAWTASERALDAARRCDSAEIETAISMRYAVWALIRQNRTAEAERVAIKAAEGIQPQMLHLDPVHAGVFGNLIFNAAVAARLSGNAARGADMLRVAEVTASRTRKDTASEAAIFGPRTVALQYVDHALRQGDPETALRLGAKVPQADGAVPAFWEAGHRLHLAAAAVQLRRDTHALGLLAQARSLAPDWTAQQPLGPSIMRKLVNRTIRRRDKKFAALAAHFGVGAATAQ